MTDFLVRQIPLPLPRPMLEENIPGASNPGIKLDIPFPEAADVDLSYPLIGLDWVLYPWTRIKGFYMNYSDWMVSQLQTGTGYTNSDRWFDVLAFLIGAGVISVSVISVYYLLKLLIFAVKKILPR